MELGQLHKTALLSRSRPTALRIMYIMLNLVLRAARPWVSNVTNLRSRLHKTPFLEKSAI
jgi:hypothetical protein